MEPTRVQGEARVPGLAVGEVACGARYRAGTYTVGSRFAETVVSTGGDGCTVGRQAPPFSSHLCVPVKGVSCMAIKTHRNRLHPTQPASPILTPLALGFP